MTDTPSAVPPDSAPSGAAPPHAAPAQLNLLILGAGAGIGACATRAALARGHAVRALSRDPSRIDAEDARLDRVPGDARDPAVLDAAVEGMDAVLYCIGTPGDARGPLGKRVTLHSEATRALLPILAAKGPRRLIAVTGYGAGDSRQAMSRVERAAHRLLLGRPYADKDRQEAMIRASDLDWTLVRPVILRNAPGRGDYRVLTDASAWRNGLISREDAADYLVRRAEDGGDLRLTPVIAW
ncbi:MAG: NAD(P)H-binding protein [Pseudomonadota bacterium]